MKKSFTVADLCRQTNIREVVGNTQARVEKMMPFDEGNTDDAVLMWVNEKNLPRAGALLHGTLICSTLPSVPAAACNYILTDHPRQVFSDILRQFFVPVMRTGIAPTAVIDSGATIGEHASIGHNVVIGHGCHFGNNVTIGHNTVILENTIIGNRVTIGCNCTIGSVGYGYEKDSQGNYQLIPHIGNVQLHDDVEIHSNTCIDKGVLGSTVICENVKIDNLVHIGHNVHIGRNSLIIANTTIAGSAVIGENSWVSPTSTIINKSVIEKDAFIGIGSVVISRIKEAEKVFGNPARVIGSTRNTQTP